MEGRHQLFAGAILPQRAAFSCFFQQRRAVVISQVRGGEGARAHELPRPDMGNIKPLRYPPDAAGAGHCRAIGIEETTRAFVTERLAGDQRRCRTARRRRGCRAGIDPRVDLIQIANDILRSLSTAVPQLREGMKEPSLGLISSLFAVGVGGAPCCSGASACRMAVQTRLKEGHRAHRRDCSSGLCLDVMPPNLFRPPTGR
jgi:hypothetical protein